MAPKTHIFSTVWDWYSITILSFIIKTIKFLKSNSRPLEVIISSGEKIFRLVILLMQFKMTPKDAVDGPKLRSQIWLVTYCILNL